MPSSKELNERIENLRSLIMIAPKVDSLEINDKKSESKPKNLTNCYLIFSSEKRRN